MTAAEVGTTSREARRWPRGHGAIAVALLLVLVARAASAGFSSAPATTQAAAVADLPPPTRVTLQLDHAPPGEAFRRLFEQAGLPTRELEGRDWPDAPVTITVRDEPFLPVLRELCRQSGAWTGMSSFPGQIVSISISGGRGAAPAPAPATPPAGAPAATQAVTGASTQPWMPLWMVAQRLRAGENESSRLAAATAEAAARPSSRPSWAGGPAQVVGPLMIVPRTARRRASVSLVRGQTAPRQRFELVLDVFVDPGVWLDGIARELHVDVARDQDGRPLAAPAAADRGRDSELTSVYGRNQWMQPVTVPLPYPPAGSTRLAELRGTLRVSFVTRVDTLKVDDLTKPREDDLHLGDVRLRLRAARPNPTRGWEVPLTVRRDGRDEPAWNELRRGLGSADLRVTDAAGRPMWTGLELTPTPDGQSFTGRIWARQYAERGQPPPARAAPAKLTWSLPAEAREVAVPVRFEDLPLP